MNNINRFSRRVAFLAIATSFTIPAVARAQNGESNKQIVACYIPNSGVVYRIKEAGLKQECSSPAHVRFSWSDGGAAEFKPVGGGASAVALFQGAPFVLKSIPAQGATPAAMSSITFTATKSGTALLTGRGFCNMNAIVGGDNLIVLSIGTTVATAFNGSAAEWGEAAVPKGMAVILGWYKYSWTAETTMPVVAGTTYTVVLAAKHYFGSAADDCSGTFKAQVF